MSEHHSIAIQSTAQSKMGNWAACSCLWWKPRKVMVWCKTL